MSETLLDETSDDLDGTAISTTVVRGENPQSTTFRCINTLDTSVDMTVKGTHGEDENYNHLQELETVSLSAGDSTKQFGGSRTTEEWERVEITLSFGANPSAGSVLVTQMGGDA